MDGLEELAGLIGRHVADEGIHPCAIPRLALIRSRQRTEPVHVVYQPSLCVVAQGAKQVMLGERVLRYAPGQFLVVSVDLPIVGQVIQAEPDRPYLALQLHLDPAMLAALLLELGPGPSPAPDPGPGLLLSTLDANLLGALVRLLRLLDQPVDIPVLAPLIEREILYRLLRGEQTAMLRQIAVVESRLQQVNRAISWIKRNFTAPFSIEAVAREARMSPSALHQHFKAVTAMSPLQYQKQLRLQEARRLLLAQARDAADVGHEVGYDSPSQFSREYRRLFGAPPTRDITRLRDTTLAFEA
ncbi:MAG TPA: AraC family transcriptional regulator [Geminicoccus sp.]|uniref:AraC family transcriptional regulator n=1 Tax=Geminicoccus sp. TaxID=2024832 RepID=UPI002C0367B7|nr:AraC family transcriptional regulator [Geminicoccus sp.]HWL71981.1 AraC family transcriptional regulator [Geminicoccus sp.]